jgi:NAD(P)-dependent dehydrogenase (short-subunit alcohol dehydrogenase family)
LEGRAERGHEATVRHLRKCANMNSVRNEESKVLDGKIGLVTGAGQGIGRAIAQEIARAGGAGVAVVDLNRQTAEETAELVREAGAEAEVIECNLRDRDQIEAMVERVAQRFGGLDMVFNNAGIIETTLTDQCSVDALPEEVWDAVYEVNLKAVWLTTKFAAPHLRRSTRGPSIVNTASVSGLTGFQLGPVYCTTKGGVIQLTKVTAVDLAPVRCNCFAPGVIETPLSSGFLDVADDRAKFERAMLSPQLIDRMGKPEEVAKLACFLASDDAAFITGATFLVDGGALAWSGVRGE